MFWRSIRASEDLRSDFEGEMFLYQYIDIIAYWILDNISYYINIYVNVIWYIICDYDTCSTNFLRGPVVIIFHGVFVWCILNKCIFHTNKKTHICVFLFVWNANPCHKLCKNWCNLCTTDYSKDKTLLISHKLLCREDILWHFMISDADDIFLLNYFAEWNNFHDVSVLTTQFSI